MSVKTSPYVEVNLLFGLGNRVNGLINGLILSHYFQKPLRFGWSIGIHCQARFDDIFDGDISSWLQPLTPVGCEFVEVSSPDALQMPGILLCPPFDRSTWKLGKTFEDVPLKTYVELYRHFFSKLRWSPVVLANLPPDWNGVAFHARTLRKNETYIPPLPAELDFVQPGVFIACDSAKWKHYFLNAIPDSFTLAVTPQDSDLGSRDRASITASAIDMLMMCRASRLYTHAPSSSTFCHPAIHGACVPTLQFPWRGHFKE